MAGYTGEETIEEYESRQRKENKMAKQKEKEKDINFLDDVEPRKETKSEDKQLVTLKGNLPVGTSQEQLNEMFEGDLKRTADGVVPRLPQIGILHAGALLFKIPSDEIGGTETVESFEGIIIDHHPCNARWKESFAKSGGGVPPVCTSLDGKTGIDEDGNTHNCPTCEYNQYGTGRDNEGKPTRGKACKNMKRLHILFSGDELPHRLTLPPTSIGQTDSLFSFLMSKRVPMTTIPTKFSLADAVSSKKIHYSQIRFEPKIHEQIEISQYLKIQNFLKNYLAQIRGQEIVSEEYAPDPNGSTDFPPPDREAEDEELEK